MSLAINLLLLTSSSLLLALLLGSANGLASNNPLLALYDQQVSSSAFGEPVFRLEPPNVISLLNTKGVTILCLASGSPRPKISWYSSGQLDPLLLLSHPQQQTTFIANSAAAADQTNSAADSNSRPIGNITNLRQISQNGAALRLLPFSEAEYRQDVHSTEYRCVASNHIATIHSTSVLVQAAIANDQQPESLDKQPKKQPKQLLRVADEFVTLGSPAVLKCRRPSDETSQSASELLSSGGRASSWLADQTAKLSPNPSSERKETNLIEWFTSDGIRIQPGEINKGNKFTAFPTGELHLSSVEMTDLRRTYGCRQSAASAMQIMSSQSSSSSGSTGLAQLILLDQSHNSDNQPQVLHTINQIVGEHSNHLQAGAKSALLDQQLGAGKQQSSSTIFEPNPVIIGGEQQTDIHNKLLLLPCAIRSGSFELSSGGEEQELRWFFQPASSAGGALTAGATPVPLDQWTAANSIPLVYIQQQQQLNITKQYRSKPSIFQQPQQQLQQQQPINRLLVGSTYLAIEWPVQANSGRYFGQLASSVAPTKRTLCDINVIVRQPIEISLELTDKQQQQNDALAQTMFQKQQIEELPTSGWFGSSWFSGRRQKRHSPVEQLELDDPILSRHIQVRGRGLIKTPPMLLVGHRLQLECRGQGYPIESLRWFRNGQPINTQSSSDFQVEIRLQPGNSGGGRLSVSSSLIIRQLQPKDVGLSVFECFAFGLLANEQVRASQSVLILDRQQLGSAQAPAPICSSSSALENQSENMPREETEDSNEVEQEEFWQPRGNRLALLQRHNPLQEALVLESEPVELACAQFVNSSSSSSQAKPAVEWYRSSDEQADRQRRRNFNQLFSGDSRFVINGSSLQIRSPSKRHDESVYFCLASKTPQAGASSSPSSGLASSLHQSSLAGCRSKLPPANSDDAQDRDRDLEQDQDQYQDRDQDRQPPGSSQLPFGGATSVSSISIRIVAKPKIDPFEFSRNLEEGMRAGVLCAVISGQSPVDISWFKDGQPLEVDEQMSVDQSNGFSSTLTFLRIKPAHSGLYTCVAANAFAAANHSSRLLVNVAPYFIEPPKSSKAILNTNVIVNCRAGGQPSPQIRWRKLVPVGSPAPGSRAQVAPAGGQSAQAKLFSDDPDLGQQVAPPESNQNLNNNKFEFRSVTSNSHIQILENGSMIIKEVELSDASRYVCQAFNGINPSLSEVIDLSVLSPAQFDVNYETVSAKRDTTIKFSCLPKGDQPMRIEWRKEANLLLPASELQLHASNSIQQQQQVSKYTEIVYLVTTGSSSNLTQPQSPMRHSSLILASSANRSSSDPVQAKTSAPVESGVKSSELYINYADRADTGTFTCVASNVYGKDELTYRLVVQEAPDTPLNVNVQSIQSNSLKLIWQAPFDGNLPIGHYVIEYRRVNVVSSPESSIGLGLETRPTLQANQHEWQRTIVGSGKLLATATSSGPGIGSSSSDQIIVMSNNSSSNSNQVQQTTLHSVVLRQLSAKTTYSLRLAAVNAIGQSSFSSHLTVTTAEDPPTSRPNDLRAQPISSGSIKVLWRGPSVIDEQAPIKGYYISHRKLILSGGTSSSSSSSPPKSQVDQSQPVEQQQPWISTSSLSASNTSLISNQDSYSGRQPVDLASSDLMLNAKQLSTRNGGALADSYEFQLNSLDRNTKYEIRVQAYNSVGLGPASETLGQTLKFDRPSQPTLRLVATKRQSLELKWSLGSPASGNKMTGAKQQQTELQTAQTDESQPLMGFSLFYKYEYDEWQEIQLGVIYHYIIDNLRCGNKYQIYLSAFNTVGRSDPSDVLNARTEGNTPIAPDKSRFFQSNITEVVLDMSQWQSAGCPISSFMIQFKRLHEQNWYVVAEGSQQFASSDKVTIPDLMPATWYKLLVTAMNEAGSTNAEYLFSTLSSSGESIGPPYGADSNGNTLAGHHQSSSWGLLAGGRPGSFLSGLGQLFASQPTANGGSDGGFLLPMSCILLLVISSLAGYLYYSRAGNSQQQPPVAGNQSSECSLLKSGGQYCGSTMNGRRRQSEKQFVSQSDASTYQIQHNLLHSMPPDTGLEAAAVVLQQSPTSNSHYATSSRHQRRQQQAMKLLPSSNLFHTNQQQQQQQPTSNCTSSSMSTNSTNCSSQGSTCGGAGQTQLGATCQVQNGGSKAKLQLIDESSMMSSASMILEQQQPSSSFVNETSHFFQSNSAQNSPARTLYSRQHVDVVGNDETNNNNLFDDLNRSTLYAQTTNQRLSSSFASAADLLQRQHQQQQQQQIYLQQQLACDEPIYQRLDKFQPNKQQHLSALAQLQKLSSQTLRFNHHHHHQQQQQPHSQMHQQSQLDDTFKSLTLNRNQLSAFQQQLDFANIQHQMDPSQVAICPAAPPPLSFQGYEQQQQHQTDDQRDYQQHEPLNDELGQCQNC